jgi:AcrR family transcriptional regulator
MPPTAKPAQIRDAAIKCFAEQGIAGTSLRTVAAAANVSHGLIQHYFATKQQLVESIDDHILNVFHQALGTSQEAPATPMSADEAGGRLADLMHKNPNIMDYIGRALAEGGEVGKVIFDGLHAITVQQGAAFAAQGLTADNLDPLWAPMLPLVLRAAAIMLRPHVERHLGGSLYDIDEMSRWNNAATRMIVGGQLKPQ